MILIDALENLRCPETNIEEHLRFSSYSPRQYPQVIKYMGSKAAILEFIGCELSKIYAPGRPIVDLFAGACAISGGFGQIGKIISNDIQEYSAVIASVYLKRAEKIDSYDIVGLAADIALANIDALPKNLTYGKSTTLSEFNKTEELNRKLLSSKFSTTHHLFTRAYSGTWWSAEQCVWIDAIRQVLDSLLSANQIEKADFNFGLTCLMHAMAYTSQGTGHYAQYRDAKTAEGMSDIRKYRLASLPAIFNRKFATLLQWHQKNVIDHEHELVAMDYRECLSITRDATVYADPPYAFVHYSRFYHAMETLVKYDYPDIQKMRGEIVKGRYRSDRHQSPFCIKSKVTGAFVDLFDGVKCADSDLLLSYSNTGMIDIETLMKLATATFGSKYKVYFNHMDHKHMTMGRKADHSRKVRESLIVAQRR